MKKSQNIKKAILDQKQPKESKKQLNLFGVVGIKHKIQHKFINQKPQDWRTWNSSTKIQQQTKKPSSNQQMKKKYLQNIKDNKSQISTSTTVTQTKTKVSLPYKAKKQTNKLNKPEIKKQKKKLRQYKQSNEIPLSYNVCRELAVNWKYYHHQQSKKVYFYPYSNMSQDLKYYRLRFKQLPQQTNSKDQKFFDSLDKFHNNPIYVVPEEILFKEIEQFKQIKRQFGISQIPKQFFRHSYGSQVKQFELNQRLFMKL